MTEISAAAGAAVLERLAWLDLSKVQYRYVRGLGTELTHHVISNITLEYRRFLLLRLLHPDQDIAAPPLIDTYWRLHATDAAAFDADRAALAATTNTSADRLVPSPEPAENPEDSTVRQLYASTFPYGNADLWGWPNLAPGHRNSAPQIGSVHQRLPNAIDKGTRTRLLSEAREQRGTITEWQSDSCRTTRRGSVSSLKRKCSADAGPVLFTLHWSDAIPRLITAATGVAVVPTATCYMYYRSGDYAGIHTDGYGCELTLLTLLSGAVEPLHCHLHLADAPLDEIRALAEAAGGLPEGGTPFDISTEPFLLSGLRIPHHRGPRERDEETVVLAQCYAVLVPTNGRVW